MPRSPAVPLRDVLVATEFARDLCPPTPTEHPEDVMARARFLLFSRRVGARPGVSWRLVAPNNREIARGTGVFATIGDCGVELEAVRSWAETAPSRLVREPASTVTQAGWRWQVDVGVRPVAVSSRAYQRRLECEVALAQFRTLAPTAMAELVLKHRA